ncbi:HAD family hydrolase [Sulfuracidifex metallicus]|uniref:HAD-IA family hydrolase n=1 Tax=Sulfuracidifex metallicus DSM 6482 = JCM 9184 TaxID=523847 RepID=A0A6A9QHT9_SULME|nr:HAD family hydrolase [Sulfuracidifex metallicus]MUN28566.1 HAD-IA family hydrolase [Sulfuracidifex metallicus DSM 6482 = JCM 9184]WOE50900.1 HAD family hydrolase [Sulfuracidifex metallicus DSM 6482 = JCM 9184]
MSRPFSYAKAIFFDYDNTLVDFQSSSIAALDKVSSEIHDYLIDEGKQNFPIEKIKQVVFSVSSRLDEEGVVDRNLWWEKSLENLGVKGIDRAQFYDWTNLYWSVAFNSEPFPDALQFLEYLANKKYIIGLITNGDGEGGNKKKRIRNFPLIDIFNIVIVGGEDGIKPKPNLDPFIVGCEKAGVSVEKCVMVGDDPVKDCLASKKAGYASVLIDRQSRIKFPELYADFVVTKLVDLEELL